MQRYRSTALMTAGDKWRAGLPALLPDVLTRALYVVPMLLLWRALIQRGVPVDMTLAQMMTYTLLSNVLTDLLVIRSSLTSWIIDGPLISLYERPMSLYGQVVAQTLGAALPMLCLFSLPALALAPLLGISIVPATLWFLPSLALCAAMGFALEFLFACLLVRLINASWLVYSIRGAILWLFSGSFVPFALLPFGLDKIMPLLPLGSLGGAPLALYVGTADPARTLAVQIFWNLVFWPLAVAAFRKTQERMTSQGG